MNEEYLSGFLSDSARTATRSEIRELLKLIARPEVISLAGGMPSPEAFPLEELARLLPRLMREQGASALQYGPTEGDAGLRRSLLRTMTLLEGGGFEGLTLDNVLVTSASQQALDLCGRVFLSPGDVVVCGLPSYLGALGAFNAAGAKLIGVPLDDDGMRTDLLERRLVDLRREDVRPKFVYCVPDFQNPAGVTLSLRRRHELLAIAREFDLLVIEDSPYRQLRYVGECLPMLSALDEDGRVISLFTFSKILFPGLRLGWVVAAPEIIAHLVVAKQPVDLCTAGLSQLVARAYLETGRLPDQIRRTCDLYRLRRAAMLHALDETIDPSWGVRWTRPEGGLFLWMTLPDDLNARELLQLALERDVAFVVGGAFHCDGSGHNTLRLNFSYPSVERVRTGVTRLAGCIGEMLKRRAAAPAAESETDPKRRPVAS